MPFQDQSFQGVPYHAPVAPVVPEPSDTAAKIISAGTQTGVMGFVHMAIAAQQAKLEQEQMLQKADLQAQELQHRDQWQKQDYEVAKIGAQSLSDLRGMQGQAEVYNAQSRLLHAASDVGSKAAQEKLVNDTMTSANVNDMRFTRDLNASRVLDPNTPPADAYLAGTDLIAKYGAAKIGAAPNMAALVQKHIDSLTIPYVPGAQLVTANGSATGNPNSKSEDDKLMWRTQTPSGKWVAGTTPIITKIGDLAAQYQDPATRDQIKNGIIAGGHGTIAETVQKKDTWRFGTADVTTKTPTLDAYAAKMLKAFERPRTAVQNQVPPALMTRQTQWQIKAGLGQPAGMTSDPAQAEAAHVKGLIQQHPELEGQLKGTFYQTYPDFDSTYFDTP